MKIILLQDDKKLGKKGQIIDVNDGFARNCVIPKKIGLEATAKNLNDLKLQTANDEKIAAQILQEAKEFKAEMEEQQVVVKMKAGEGGKAFGSVSSKEIAKAYLDQYGKELDKKKIVIPDAIKGFGVYEVKVKLHQKVTACLKVKVVEEGK